MSEILGLPRPRLCLCWTYHRRPASLLHRLAPFTRCGGSFKSGQRLPSAHSSHSLRHCLPSWFTLHSQAVLHFPQSTWHSQSAGPLRRVAFGHTSALFPAQLLALPDDLWEVILRAASGHHGSHQL